MSGLSGASGISASGGSSKSSDGDSSKSSDGDSSEKSGFPSNDDDTKATVITGTLTMTVDDPEAFCSSSIPKERIAEVLAGLHTALSSGMIEYSCAVGDSDDRRLKEDCRGPCRSPHRVVFRHDRIQLRSRGL